MSTTASCPNCGAPLPTGAPCGKCGHRPPESSADSATNPPRWGHGSTPPGPPLGPPPRFGPSPQHPDVPPTSTKGFFTELFDFRFTTFITPVVIKFLYAAVTVVIALIWIFYVFLGFTISLVGGLLVLIFGPVVALVWLLVWRIALELTMVLFRIGADIHTIRDQNDLGNRRILITEEVPSRPTPPTGGVS